MIIDQLPSVGTPALTDETVTEQGQNLFKVTWQRLLALFKANTTPADIGAVDSAGAAAAAPVQSVNGMTGEVTIPSAPLSDDNPQPLGTATPGTSTNVSRADHVHAMPTADEVGAMSQWDLLWTNASPGSAFADQTVALDLSEYDAVIIDTGLANDDHKGKSFTCFVGRAYYLDLFPLTATTRYGRTADITQTGVVFSQGYFNTSANNVCVIPLKIYGIKGVQ